MWFGLSGVARPTEYHDVYTRILRVIVHTKSSRIRDREACVALPAPPSQRSRSRTDVLTLAYLAKQIRENTILNRVSGTMAIADAARDIHFLLAGDADTARVFLKGVTSPDTLDKVDRVRFEQLWWGVLRQMESFFVQFEHGLMDEASMNAYARFSADLIRDNSVIRDHWQAAAEDYSPKFVDWLNALSASRRR